MTNSIPDRDALVRYLDAVYAGRDNPLILSKLTDKSFQDLDAEYRKFMESGQTPRRADAAK